MKDGFGREIDYLRISLTDKCNLRCRYCMPEEGIRHLSHTDLLTFEEIRRLVSLMSELGIRRVRLTGGEPLVRRGVVDLVKMLHEKISTVCMTSNGCMLAEYAGALKDAGLSAVNISLDTLDRKTFAGLTGTDALDHVLEGIDAAIGEGLQVKLNCVPLRGINEDEMAELVSFAQEKRVEIRFIELMPVGCGKCMRGISSEEVLKILERTFGSAVRVDPAERKAGTNGSGPAAYYHFTGYDGSVGFISPMSHKFCDRCNRLRLTAEGYLKLCLQYPAGVDLKEPLRSGATDAELTHRIEEAVFKKPCSHSFGEPAVSDKRNMIQIGG